MRLCVETAPIKRPSENYRDTPCTIWLDQVPMAASTLDVAVAVNPGPDVVAVTAVGRAENRFEVFLSDGESQHVYVSPGEPSATEDVPASPERR